MKYRQTDFTVSPLKKQFKLKLTYLIIIIIKNNERIEPLRTINVAYQNLKRKNLYLTMIL